VTFHLVVIRDVMTSKFTSILRVRDMQTWSCGMHALVRWRYIFQSYETSCIRCRTLTRLGSAIDWWTPRASWLAVSLRSLL
jgi:hypothetical protein